MTAEEADVIAQLTAERGGALELAAMTRRQAAVSGRLEANTNYLRVIQDCACIAGPGIEALKRYRKAFAKTHQ